MNRHDSSHLEALLQVGDYARLADLLRTAHRHNDTELLERLTEVIYKWLESHWLARPLPRLGKLMELLAERRETSAAQTARAAEGHYLDEAVWTPLLEDSRDWSAALALITKARSPEIGERLVALQEKVGATRNPVLSATFLRWLEAPPFRATSTQPIWNRVFEILYDQGDPRTLEALRRLEGTLFPAGKSMQTWMGEKLERELARWSQRPDVDTLNAQLHPNAEGDLSSTLDRLAESIAALTGAELVGSGGEAVTRDLNILLTPKEVVPSRWSMSTETLVSNFSMPFSRNVDIRGESRRDAVTHSDERETRFLIADAYPGWQPREVIGELLVIEADGRLLWQEHLSEGTSACELSPCGRWVASLTWDRSLILRDLKTQRTTRVRILESPLPTQTHHRLAHGRMITFGEGAELFTVHSVLSASGLPLAIHGRDTWVIRTRFDSETLTVTSIERVLRIDSLRMPTACPATIQHTVDSDGQSQIAISPNQRWLFVRASPEIHQARTREMIFDMKNGFQLRQAFDWNGSPEFRFDDENQLIAWQPAHRIWHTGKAVHLPAKKFTIDPETAKVLREEEAVDPWSSEVFDDSLRIAPSVAALAVAESGRFAAGSLVDGNSVVKVWSASGELELELKEDNHVGALALSPDGSRLALACTMNIQVIDLESTTKKRPKPKRLKGHKDAPWAMEWSHGRLISSAMDAVLVWSNDEVKHDLRPGPNPRQLAVHPDGELLACATDESLTLWDLTDGSELARHPLAIQTTALTWSLDGSEVVYTAGASLRTWAPRSGGDRERWLGKSPIRALRTSSQNGVMLATDDDGIVWRLVTGSDTWEVKPLAALHATGQLRIGKSGQILVGAGCVGLRGSLTILTPRENSGTPSEGGQ